MQWDKQTEAALNGWFNTPQKAWEQWWDIVAGSTQNGHATASTPPALDYWNGITNQWLAYMQKNMELFSPMLAESSRTAMAQFTMGQNHSNHLLQMATEAWQAIMRSAGSVEEWQPALTQYMDQLRQQVQGADAGKFLQNQTELWQLYTTEMQKFTQPWLAMWTAWPQQMGAMTIPGVIPGAKGDNPLLAMANLYWDTYQQTLGRLVNMPSLGLMRELNEKINRGFTVWQENQQISFAYQVLLSDAFMNAFEAFMQRLLLMAKEGKTIESQSKLLELWVEVADEQYLTMFHSERYATVQSQYVNSSMALRRHQRELSEVLLRINDLPTRSDLDEAHHNIFLLRKEVKALKKSLNELAGTGARSAVVEPTASSATPKNAAAKAKDTGATQPQAKQSTARRTKPTQAKKGA